MKKERRNVELDKRIHDLKDDGFNFAEIGRLLNLTRARVQQRYWRHKKILDKANTKENKKKVQWQWTHFKKKNNIIPERCVVCNSKETECHHEDYTKPFEVIWMCPYHHMKLHQISNSLNVSLERSLDFVKKIFK